MSARTLAMIVAAVALVLAIGGTAIAGPGAISNKITRAKVRTIARNQATKVFDARRDELQGERGPQGPVGEAGPPGLPGATNVIRRIGTEVVIDPDSIGQASVTCNLGERAVGGGGADWNGSVADFVMTMSRPIIPSGSPTDTGVPHGWEVRYYNADANRNDSGTIGVRAYVVCASP